MHPDFAFLLDTKFSGYPDEYVNPSNGDRFPVAPFQYIESHDHPRFITRIAPTSVKDLLGYPYGDRSQFYRLQPYAIALFTAQGIPMLWQGQEIGENGDYQIRVLKELFLKDRFIGSISMIVTVRH
jgi:glycosidase